jgi:hypothetical protein
MDLDAARFNEDGFCRVPDLLAAAEVQSLLDWAGREPSGPRPRAGRRDLGQLAGLVHFLRAHPGINGCVARLLGEGAFPVRVLLFDKTAASNWFVSWHQDLTVALAGRRDAGGWSAWSKKDGILHAQPPAVVLEAMLTLRLHLDDCGPDQGPLRVLAGSPRHGRLAAEAIRRLVADGREIPCVARRGDGLAMRPLLLHASSKARRPGHRRVLHVEYAAAELPDGLVWHSRAAWR